MGWFWGSSDSEDGKKAQDPLRDLDPGLRDFLAKESPVKYSSTNSPPTSQTPIPPPAVLPTTSEGIPSKRRADENVDNTPAPPTLYPDGRYAHLWKTYRPLSETEAEAKSDQEKINDILEGYNQRKAEIGRAALENCALEQCDVNECFRSGGWKSRITMCRTENRKFERCYMMQSVCKWLMLPRSLTRMLSLTCVQKFLKALGYLSTYDRPREVDEQIQMHADTLYHRMLDQEERIEAAKAEGRPVPSFPPLLSSNKASIATMAESTFDKNKVKASELPPKVQAGLKKRLDGLNDEERQVEERAIQAEIQAGEQVAGNLEKIYESQAEERRRRKEQGKETMGDRIHSIFGFR